MTGKAGLRHIGSCADGVHRERGARSSARHVDLDLPVAVRIVSSSGTALPAPPALRRVPRNAPAVRALREGQGLRAKCPARCAHDRLEVRVFTVSSTHGLALRTLRTDLRLGAGAFRILSALTLPRIPWRSRIAPCAGAEPHSSLSAAGRLLPGMSTMVLLARCGNARSIVRQEGVRSCCPQLAILSIAQYARCVERIGSAVDAPPFFASSLGFAICRAARLA